MREKERQRATERETERQIQRETEKETDMHACMHGQTDRPTFLVLRLGCFGINSPFQWLLLASSGYRQDRVRMCYVTRTIVFHEKEFRYLYHLNMKKRQKTVYFLCFSKWIQCENISTKSCLMAFSFTDECYHYTQTALQYRSRPWLQKRSFSKDDCITVADSILTDDLNLI